MSDQEIDEILDLPSTESDSNDNEDVEVFIFLIYAFALMCLAAYSKVRERSRLSFGAYPPPEMSAWRYLLYRADDSSFLHVTGFTRSAFNQLYYILFPEEKRLGRPVKITRADRLGMLLFFVGSKMAEKHIAMLFGTSIPNVSKIIHQMVHLTVRRLEDNEIAAIGFRWDAGRDRLSSLARR